MSTITELEKLTERFEQLKDGHTRHVQERGWLRHQRRRLAMRNYRSERCGRPVDADDEIDLALLGLTLSDIILTLQKAEEVERQDRRRIWLAGAADREIEREREQARREQAAREQRRRPYTEREKAQLRADGYRVDEDLPR